MNDANQGIQNNVAPVRDGEEQITKIQHHALVIPFFLMTAIALPFTVVSQSPMFRDGSYYFLRIWQSGQAMAPHQRISDLLIQTPIVLAITLFQNFDIARFSFCLTYASIPVISLVLSWLLVRKSRTELMVWPVVAIGLTSLVCRPDSTSENVICSMLIWPVYLSLLSNPGLLKALFLVLLALFLVFLHPSSGPYLICMSVAASLLALRNPIERKKLASLAAVLGLLGVGRAFYLMFYPQPYEQDLLAGGTFFNYMLESGTGSLPLITGIGSIVGGIALVVETIKKKFAPIISSSLFALSGIGALAWSVLPKFWYQAYWNEKIMVLYFGALMVCALIDATQPEADQTAAVKKLRFRRIVCSLIGLISMVALVAQALSWEGLSQRLKHEIAGRSESIITLEDLSWIKETPMDHWSTASYAIVLQGRFPCKYILPAKQVAECRKSGNIKITKWDKSFTGNAFRLPDKNTSD